MRIHHIFIIISLFVFSCKNKQKDEKLEENQTTSYNTALTDTIITRKSSSILEFDSVLIGNQIWMSKNLSVNVFRNGDSIPQVGTDEDWESACRNCMPAWCYYDNNEENDITNGKLYNWYAVIDERGLAPAGWIIPSLDDWREMVIHFNGLNIAAKKLMSLEGWNYIDGTNTSGFCALAGGGRLFRGKFKNQKTDAYFWSSTEYIDSSKAYCFLLNADLPMITGLHKDYGLSVRCLTE